MIQLTRDRLPFGLSSQSHTRRGRLGQKFGHFWQARKNSLSYLILIVAAAAAAPGQNSSDDEWRCKLGGVLLSSLDDDDRM